VGEVAADPAVLSGAVVPVVGERPAEGTAGLEGVDLGYHIKRRRGCGTIAR
jgi:hypothetical protein